MNKLKIAVFVTLIWCLLMLMVDMHQIGNDDAFVAYLWCILFVIMIGIYEYTDYRMCDKMEVLEKENYRMEKTLQLEKDKRGVLLHNQEQYQNVLIKQQELIEKLQRIIDEK